MGQRPVVIVFVRRTAGPGDADLEPVGGGDDWGRLRGKVAAAVTIRDIFGRRAEDERQVPSAAAGSSRSS